MERVDLSEAQYELALAGHGVDLEIHQQTCGRYRVSMGTREMNGTVLYYGDHNQSYLTHLELPPKSVGIIAASSPRGPLAANGDPVDQDSVSLFPPSGVDLVVPAKTSADSFTMPELRFYKLAEAVSPGLQSCDRATVVRGDAEGLRWLRRESRRLVREPVAGRDNVYFDNLIAEWVAWLGQPDALIERSHSVAREHRAQIARRARVYFMDHFAQPLRMEDACREMGVGLRTLQRCFASYFQQSPQQYLKFLRYNKARHALLRHNPSTNSVSRIAMDNGFQHFGRFAVEYRHLFGEKPRATLAEKPVAIAA